jgi:iron complex outermembrane receptor protein
MSRLEDTGGCFIGVCSTGDPAQGNFLGSTTYHDVSVQWRAPWDATLQVGARNLFGKEPPLTANSFAHSFDAAYDLPGGAYWFASYRQDF